MSNELNGWNEKASEPNPESDLIRARGLVRLLIYALLDAEEIGCEPAAMSIRAAINSLKNSFKLTELDLVRSDRPFTD